MTPLVYFFFLKPIPICVSFVSEGYPTHACQLVEKQNSRCSNLLGLTVFPVCFSLLLLFFLLGVAGYAGGAHVAAATPSD